MSRSERIAHSLVEVHLYAALLGCRACSRRGFRVGQADVEQDDAAIRLHVRAECAACAEPIAFTVDASACGPEHLRPESVRRIPIVINPTGERSDLIDAGQWLTLYGMAVDSAGFPADRKLIRAALIEAGQCLAEALRFYPDDSDIPPPTAFFSAESLERFREHPEIFTRQRLIEWAGALPSSSVHPPAAVLRSRPVSTMWWLP